MRLLLLEDDALLGDRLSEYLRGEGHVVDWCTSLHQALALRGEPFDVWLVDWQLPDVIMYPAGGGTGLIGIWKAFQEMKTLGWLTEDQPLPRMVAVQAENCCPLVKTYLGEQANCKQYVGKPSLANGLAVPRPIGEPLMLQVLRESGGTTLAISEEDMLEGVRVIARQEGMFVAPEGGALWMATRQLMTQGWIRPDEHVLLLNTGSGQKYLDHIKGTW